MLCPHCFSRRPGISGGYGGGRQLRLCQPADYCPLGSGNPGTGSGIGPRVLQLELVYDLCHNIAKFEDHLVDGRMKRLCVHRKGATRAFPPHHPQIPEDYRELGQPVLIPGDMGRYSYVLLGTDQAMNETFGSACHGAGRVMSRQAAKRPPGAGRNS